VCLIRQPHSSGMEELDVDLIIIGGVILSLIIISCCTCFCLSDGTSPSTISTEQPSISFTNVESDFTHFSPFPNHHHHAAEIAAVHHHNHHND
ncbi:hypothetical protein PMAYCL1PPCAC_10659, partial [Pristionchus mayeri]